MNQLLRSRVPLYALLLVSPLLPTQPLAAALPISQRPAAEVPGYLGFVFIYIEPRRGEGRLEIVDVVAQSPADKAGLKENDRVAAIDGLEFHFPDWERLPINPFKWVTPGTDLKLRVERSGSTLDIVIAAVVSPTPPRDVEADLRRQAKQAWGEKIFERLAVRGLEMRLERGADGQLRVFAEGVPAFDLEALAAVLEPRAAVLGLIVKKGEVKRYRLERDKDRGWPRLRELPNGS